MNKYIFLAVIIVIALGIPVFFNMPFSLEGYSNYTLGGATGDYPNAQTGVLLQDTYPAIGKNELSNESAENMWQRYPIFKLGSYEQTTNNIRYPNNPDDARCTPANFCYAVYKDKDIGSNVVNPLPPLDPNDGTRVGYFDTDKSLMTFRTNMQNILY
jgi:hypothetical protein